MKLLLNPTQLTCQITIGNWPACKGVQKLIGLGRGLRFHRVPYFPYWHHSNSIRLAYNRSENKDFVRLWNYSYFKGERLEKHIGDFFVDEKLDVKLIFDNKTIAAMVKRLHDNVYSHQGNFYRPNNIGKFGFLLYPYSEIDGHENKQIPFEVDIKDLKVNGKNVR